MLRMPSAEEVKGGGGGGGVSAARGPKEWTSPNTSVGREGRRKVKGSGRGEEEGEGKGGRGRGGEGRGGEGRGGEKRERRRGRGGEGRKGKGGGREAEGFPLTWSRATPASRMRPTSSPAASAASPLAARTLSMADPRAALREPGPFAHDLSNMTSAASKSPAATDPRHHRAAPLRCRRMEPCKGAESSSPSTPLPLPLDLLSPWRRAAVTRAVAVQTSSGIPAAPLASTT